MKTPTRETFVAIARMVTETIEENIADGTYDLDSLGRDEIAEIATECVEDAGLDITEDDIDTDMQIALLNAVYDGAMAATDEETTDWRLAFDPAKFEKGAWDSFFAFLWFVEHTK